MSSGELFPGFLIRILTGIFPSASLDVIHSVMGFVAALLIVKWSGMRA